MKITRATADETRFVNLAYALEWYGKCNDELPLAIHVSLNDFAFLGRMIRNPSERPATAVEASVPADPLAGGFTALTWRLEGLNRTAEIPIFVETERPDGNPRAEWVPKLSDAQRTLLCQLAPENRHYDYLGYGAVREGYEKNAFSRAGGRWISCARRDTAVCLERLKVVERAPHPSSASAECGIWTINAYGRRVVARLQEKSSDVR